MPEHARIDKTLTLSIPAELETGDYAVKTFLRRGGALVQETSTPFFVCGADTGKLSVKASVKVALYEAKEKTATKKVLDDLGVTYKQLENLSNLAGYDVLILGADSIDMFVAAQTDELRAWIEKGGRLVCLEQSHEGAIPFAKPLRFLSSGNMLFADQIDGAHPTQAGLAPGYWELWNGQCEKSGSGVSATAKTIYSTYVIPIPESVVLSGGNRGQYRFGQNPILGMVSGEVKLGKGAIFFSQPLAISRYGTDPVASLYLRNVLGYTLSSQWTGENATDLKNITPPPAKRKEK